jgi:hypothetical protein
LLFNAPDFKNCSENEAEANSTVGLDLKRPHGCVIPAGKLCCPPGPVFIDLTFDHRMHEQSCVLIMLISPPEQEHPQQALSYKTTFKLFEM